MIVNYFRYIVSTRITNFHIILNNFSKGVIIFKMFAYETQKIFAYIDIKEFTKNGVKPDNISTSIFINIFTYFIIHIYIIISSIGSSIFLTIISNTIVPVYVISIGFQIIKFIFITAII